ncbi:Transient receptor putative cation channel sub V member 3 [Rhizoclosmatium sp. JEL0117]|nr:Transient receptor putative cation channel sub V member 3 [Rhizoclosmatium sp. JEL0117]
MANNQTPLEKLWSNHQERDDGHDKDEDGMSVVSWYDIRDQSWLFGNDDLWKAVAHGSLAQIKEYANKKPDGLRMRGETALHLAVVQEEDQDPSDDILSKEDRSVLRGLRERKKPNAVTLITVDDDDYRYSGKSIVRMLIEAGASTDNKHRATGAEFNFADKGTLRFYGQTVAHFAAVSGKPKIVEYLVDRGADVNAIDLNTNDNILHLLLKNEGMDKNCFARMFQFLKSKAPSLLDGKNIDNEGIERTPYQLGMHSENSNVLEAMKEELWEFDRTHRYRVPLNLLDPIHAPLDESSTQLDPHNNLKNPNLLELVIERHNEEMLNHPVMKTILQWKWNAYAKHIYFRKLMMFFVLIVFLLTPAIALQPNTPESRISYTYRNGFDVARGFFEVGTLVGTWNAADNYLRWIFSAIVITVPFIRIAGPSEVMFNVENVVLGFAMISGYLYLLTFAKGSATIGHLVVIVKEIVAKDFPEWLFVYIPTTVGFGGALFMQMQNVGNVASSEGGAASDSLYDWDSLLGSSLWAVRFIFQEEKYEDIKKGALPVYSQLLFLTYALFAVVLLVNVLIAKLVNTFDRINEKSEKVWRMELAALIMSIDMGLSEKEKKAIRNNFGFHKEVPAGTKQTTEAEVQVKYLQFTEREWRDERGQLVSEVHQVVAQQLDQLEKFTFVDMPPENKRRSLWRSSSKNEADLKPKGPPTEKTPNDCFILEPKDLEHWRGWAAEMQTVFNKPTYNLLASSWKVRNGRKAKLKSVEVCSFTNKKMADTELEALRGIPTCDLADAMTRLQMGIRFVHNGQLVSPGPASPLQSSTYFLGRAHVAAFAAFESPVEASKSNAVDTLTANQVLVLKGVAGAPNAVFGGLLAARAVAVGAVGAVVDVRIRDVNEVRSFESVFAVVSTSQAQSVLGAPTWAKCVQVGGQIVLAEDTQFPITVSENDIVIADIDGCVVVPPSRALEVAQLARKIQAQDALCKIDIEQHGSTLVDAFKKHRS